MNFSIRLANALAGVACFVLIAIAYFYFEKHEFFTPCPLCYAQRIVFGILGFFFFIAAIFPGGRIGSKVHGIWLFLIALGGIALAVRHVIIQNRPKENLPSCGQDFYALVENTPFANVVKTMISGSSECGEIQWVFLGLSIPGWALVAFIGFAVWALFHNVFRRML